MPFFGLLDILMSGYSFLAIGAVSTLVAAMQYAKVGVLSSTRVLPSPGKTLMTGLAFAALGLNAVVTPPGTLRFAIAVFVAGAYVIILGLFNYQKVK